MAAIWATFIRRLASIRQLLISRWECWFVAREHINRQALTAELAACIMYSSMLCFFVFVYMPVFAIVSFTRFFNLISFDSNLYSVVASGGGYVYFMIMLGLFSYAGIVRLISLKNYYFAMRAIPFLFACCFIYIAYTVYFPPAHVYDNHLLYIRRINGILFILCSWIGSYHAGVFMLRFICGDPSQRIEKFTSKKYITINLVFAVLFISSLDSLIFG